MSTTAAEIPQFVEITPADEDFHGIVKGHGFTASETNYLGFSIPEHNINCEIYMWAHPVFKSCAGGIFIYQGKKRRTLEAEHHNFFAHQPMPENFLDYQLAMGLKVKIEKPTQRVRVSYVDAETDTEFDVTLTGIAPPVGRPGGGHFTQSCKTAGRLKLRGQEYEVNGFFSRDHSWSHERPETRRRMPPMTWMVGIFDDELAFHVTGSDDLARHPQWRKWQPKLPEAFPFGWGYLIEAGKVIPLTDMRNKLTTRADDGTTPVGYQLEIVDAKGRTHEIQGTVKADCPFHWWPNMMTHMSLVEWKMNGRTGYGDAQDIQWSDWIADHVKP